jgi:hypothetical protein
MGERFPGPESESWRLHQATLRLADFDPAAADRASRATGDRDEHDRDGPDALGKLALSFESLGGGGGSGGCEFGIFQRFCGEEPLDLFRWAGVSPANLIACLTARFEGLGDPGTIEVLANVSHDIPLWEIYDKKFGTAMHSFVPVDEVPAEQMVISARRRMRYLKDKLIADLEEGSKIFVLKIAERQLTQDEANGLSEGIRSFGPGTILCVCPSDHEHAAGSVAVAAPGVLVGYIDFFGIADQQDRMPAWLALCQTVLSSGPNQS